MYLWLCYNPFVLDTSFLNLAVYIIGMNLHGTKLSLVVRLLLMSLKIWCRSYLLEKNTTPSSSIVVKSIAKAKWSLRTAWVSAFISVNYFSSCKSFCSEHCADRVSDYDLWEGYKILIWLVMFLDIYDSIHKTCAISRLELEGTLGPWPDSVICLLTEF